jgi:hypothetical protein
LKGKNKITTHATICAGKMQVDNRPYFTERLSQLKDGHYILTVEKYSHKRSIKENRYYWGVVVQMCMDGLIEAGFDWIKEQEDTHTLLKSMFLKENKPGIGGEIIEVVLSTSSLSTDEFQAYMDRVKHWAAEYIGVFIPEPGQQAQIDYK